MTNLNENKLTGIVIPVYKTLLLPGVTTIIHMDKSESSPFDQTRFTHTNSIALPVKGAFDQENITADDFHKVGVLFSVTNMEQEEDGYNMTIQVGERVEIDDLVVHKDSIEASYSFFNEQDDLSPQNSEEMLHYLKKIVREISANFRGGENYIKIADAYDDLNGLISYLSQFMSLTADEKYELLKIDSLKERSLLFMDFLLRQKENVNLQMQINERFSEKANKRYREQMLRQQLKVIQDELNEGKTSRQKKSEDYETKIEEADLPKDIYEMAMDELDKLNSSGQDNAEQNITRNYLDFILKLPWKKEKAHSIDLEKARNILNEQHYGLERVKERIIQHLAVMQLKKEKKGSVLLLVGPPGTGKTSLGKSIAQALDRKYIRISLGGIRDEAEIRGHRRTYIGAIPGRILQSIKKAGTNNPVMVLDEVDKIMAGGYSGDPASALLEVLDPEQNNTFTDHYLDQPFDLSDVFFIATANTTDTIPGPLLDRMEIIPITSYTPDEKFHIGKEHLLPDVLEEHGLSKNQLLITDEMLSKIIFEYTMEAGVRGLKKQLSALARYASEKIVSGKVNGTFTVNQNTLEEILGHKVSRHEKAQTSNPPGIVTGLAWTPVGGEILFIETTDMPGTGQIILTGQLGDVMKESARISLSLLKSRLPLNMMDFKQKDLHIHVPSGSVPKDGPSAGIALFTALASLVTDKEVDSKLAMTGEITLRGAVMPIGGLKEKLLGAQRAGITKVLIPKDNMIDLKDVSEEVKQTLTIIPVETTEDVLQEALHISLPRLEHVVSDVSPNTATNRNKYSG